MNLIFLLKTFKKLHVYFKISWSTNKHINTNKRYFLKNALHGYFFTNFGSLQRWWVLPGPNITAGTKKRAKYSTWCHIIRSQGNWWGPVLHWYFICDQNNLKKTQFLNHVLDDITTTIFWFRTALSNELSFSLHTSYY